MAKIEPKIFDELKTALSSFDGKYFVGEELNRSKLTDDLRNYDETLLSKLFEVDFIKQHFIKEVAGQKLFQIEQLEEVVLYNDYWNTSYTKYENRVGLASKGKFLQDSQDVVLDFPFKDGVLTASMTKEDNEDGYDDAFLNEVIEKDEIDRLFDKKVFVNVKRFGDNQTAQHRTAVDNEIVSFDKEKDNLIIKGNNLLALHTLREHYTGKIKLIYIDPPYNTGSDSFLYNDRFNHSAWLTFMKNRLEIARELLREDGYIFIQTDDSEQAYLKVLMDSIFGSEQYVNTISVLFKNIAGASGGGEDKRLKKNVEFITVYSKNYEMAVPFSAVYEKQEISEQLEEYRAEGKSWKYNNLLLDEGTKEYVGSTVDGSGDEIRMYKHSNFQIPAISKQMKLEGLSEKDFYEKYYDKIYRGTMPQSSIRTRVMDKWGELGLTDNPLMSIEYVPRSGRNKGKLYKQFYSGNKFNLFAWLSDVVEVDENGTVYKTQKAGTFWNYVGETKNVNKEGQVEFPNGKKPERLLGKIIEMASDEGDTVLDFFGGSGSTAAAAMKMNRKFISLEQMENQVQLEINRLNNVIAGKDKNGLTQDVNWQGGGSFVYAELFPKNMGYLQDVIHAKDFDELKAVYVLMLSGTDTDEPADISFRADLTKIDWLQGFDENKRLLVKLLDKNGLYYNYSEIDDKNVRDLISDEDYTFNKTFYEGGD
ncbi:DNA methyltransferase [Enterococcus mediterraneensis]|uniref:DNA methyltransferase n=1 Tax=Enterococcus mediterraneensis TaxID=2364791 RepID=UPI000F04EFD9|nr:site-specific DNA-methyltransferase [Enterococcus mediterraneensis]